MERCFSLTLSRTLASVRNHHGFGMRVKEKEL